MEYIVNFFLQRKKPQNITAHYQLSDHLISDENNFMTHDSQIKTNSSRLTCFLFRAKALYLNMEDISKWICVITGVLFVLTSAEEDP